MVSVIVVVVVVVNVLVWAAAVVEVLFIDSLAGVGTIVVGVVMKTLKFAFPVAYSVDVPSEVAVDLFMDKLMLGVLPGIGIALVFIGVSANAFAVVITALEFPVPKTLEECSR